MLHEVLELHLKVILTKFVLHIGGVRHQEDRRELIQARFEIIQGTQQRALILRIVSPAVGFRPLLDQTDERGSLGSRCVVLDLQGRGGLEDIGKFFLLSAAGDGPSAPLFFSSRWIATDLAALSFCSLAILRGRVDVLHLSARFLLAGFHLLFVVHPGLADFLPELVLQEAPNNVFAMWSEMTQSPPSFAARAQYVVAKLIALSRS